MEQLEELIQKAESDYLATVSGILKLSCSSRTKIALIYKAHVRCMVAIDDLVAEAKLASQLSVVVSSN